MLACRRRAIVTGVTGTRRNTTMIKHRGRPAIGAVAIITLITTGDMGRGLAGCDGAIVTAEAGTDNMGVIHPVDRSPVGRCMTIFTDNGNIKQ